MRFSLFLQIAVVCTFASSAFAVPVPGKDQPAAPAPANANSNSKPPGEKAAAAAAAAGAAHPGTNVKPGDVVLVKPMHFLDQGDSKGGAPGKPRPAVVVLPADKAGVVAVVPVGHKLPGASHTDNPGNYGIPNSNDNPNHFISTGPPAQIHIQHVKPVNGHGGLPEKISPEHLDSLKSKIVENMDSVMSAKKQKVESAKGEKGKDAAPAPAPGPGLYDDIPPPQQPKAPAGGLYDDLPAPKSAGKPADHGAANVQPAAGAGASNSKKRPLERRTLYKRAPDYHPITGERLSRRLHARSRSEW